MGADSLPPCHPPHTPACPRICLRHVQGSSRSVSPAEEAKAGCATFLGCAGRGRRSAAVASDAACAPEGGPNLVAAALESKDDKFVKVGCWVGQGRRPARMMGQASSWWPDALAQLIADTLPACLPACLPA
jgi:hypothetical protein